MKRRKFIRNMGLAGISHGLIGRALASDECCSLHGSPIDTTGGISSLKLHQSLSLTEFQGEQEEGPCLVTDGEGGDWLFSLRRLPYPNDKEVVSCFAHVNGKWMEQDSVSPEEGQYEAITASCCLGGPCCLGSLARSSVVT